MSWHEFCEMMSNFRHGTWCWHWDDRKPLPGIIGWPTYLWYDGPHFGVRVWRFALYVGDPRYGDL